MLFMSIIGAEGLGVPPIYLCFPSFPSMSAPRLPQKCHYCVKGPDLFNHGSPQHSQTHPFHSSVLWYSHPSIHSSNSPGRQSGGYTIRNNNVQGSCDQAVRQAGGLVLELWVALTGRDREEEEESKAVGCLLTYIYSTNVQGTSNRRGWHVKWHVPFYSLFHCLFSSLTYIHTKTITKICKPFKQNIFCSIKSKTSENTVQHTSLHPHKLTISLLRKGWQYVRMYEP